MRAVLFDKIGQKLQVEHVEPINPGTQDVVVEIGASGVCGSDHHVLTGALPMGSPIVLGHEAAGRVVAVGAAVSRIRIGDHVIAAYPNCGACWYCAVGEPTLCELASTIRQIPRVTRDNGDVATTMVGLGTFAELMTVNEASLVRVETDLPDEQLALIGCGVTTGVGAALTSAEVRPGTRVAVLGCGGVGLSVIQGARVAGAAQIIAIDPLESRRVAAKVSGATDVIDPAEGDVIDQVRSLTGGRGSDYSFEAVGRPSTVQDALRMVRRGGTVVVVGAASPNDRLDLGMWDLFLSGITVKMTMFGSVNIRRDIPRFVALAESGRLDLAALITGVVALETDAVNLAFDELASGKALRTILRP